MAESLTTQLWTENFVYGPVNTNPAPDLPDALDFGPTLVETADEGFLGLAGPTGFVLRGPGADNEDAKFPYGGTTTSVRGYLRFPLLGWGAVAGLVVRPRTVSPAALYFDSAFSGHPRDKIYVLVATAAGVWSTRQVITNTAGYGWSTRSVDLPPGESAVAVLLRTAPVSDPTTAGGVATGQADLGNVPLERRLRISNLRITFPGTPPVAPSTRQLLRADSRLAIARASLEPHFVPLRLLTNASLSLRATVSPYLFWATDAALTLANEVGAEARVRLEGESRMTASAEVSVRASSATAGFMVGSTAALAVESMLLPGIEDRIRPLLSTTVVMTRPVIRGGRPYTPRARAVTETLTSVAGEIEGRISPYSVKHVYPKLRSSLSPLFRWLSIDARYDPLSGELVSWPEHQEDAQVLPGPAWGTPGGYRPTVAPYAMATDGNHESLNYPAVHFDATKLDHLNVTLPAESKTADGANGESVTWFLVGSYTRYRGVLRDSCPILDFTGSTEIDYTTEQSAVRGEPPPGWSDPVGPSMYTGWTAYSDAAPQTSMLAWRGPTGAEASARSLPYVDNTPVVLAITVNGPASFVQVTSITGTGPATGRLTVATPRQVFRTEGGAALPHTFTLGKSRHRVPYDGLLPTGSMSLLEVSFYKQPLTAAETGQIAAYLAGVYAPAGLTEAAAEQTRPQLPGGGRASAGRDELIFTTADTNDPYWLLADGRAQQLPHGVATALTESGRVALAYVGAADYLQMVALFGEYPLGGP